MTSFDVSSLVSPGIDTTTVISQLMAVAAQPQDLLKTQLSTQQSVTAAYASLNTQLAAVQSAADALTTASGWDASAVASSDPSVAAATVPGANAGSSTTFSVLKVATAQVTTVAAGSGDIADPANGIDLVDSTGTAHHLDITSGSAADVASAVNAAGLGVQASVLTTDSGSILQLNSTTTGAAAAFSVTGLSVASQNMTTAQDAQISVGDPTAGGYTVSSATNTFTGAIPGVTFTVSQPISNVTLSVSPDETTISNGVSGLITAVNAALSTIATDTAQGGILAGDSTLRGIQQQLFSAISSGAAGTSYNPYGVDLNAVGVVTFDPSAFATAFGQDPTSTQNTLSTLASGFSAIADGAVNASTGSIAQLLTSGASKADDLTTQISDWDTRLADQQTALQTRFTAMDTILANLKSQSNYLTSMFASINQSSSSSSSSSS